MSGRPQKSLRTIQKKTNKKVEIDLLEQYRSARAFAMEYGAFLGIIWVLVFCALLGGFIGGSVLLVFLMLFFMALSVVAPFYLAWRFKQHLVSGEQYTWMAAWSFAMLMFLFASLITAVAEYVYFALIDGGMMFDMLYAMLTNPEIEAQYKAIGEMQLLETTRQQLDMAASLTPLDIAINAFANSLMFSMLFSLPVAYVAHRKSREINLDKFK